MYTMVVVRGNAPRNKEAAMGRFGKGVMMLAAAGFGLLIALVDTSPGWDDTGITVLTLLLISGAFAAANQKRPWLWALLVGAWVPVLNVALSGNYGAWLALVPAFMGAYVGALARKLLGAAGQLQ